jgi:hypothetical protein
LKAIPSPGLDLVSSSKGFTMNIHIECSRQFAKLLLK